MPFRPELGRDALAGLARRLEAAQRPVQDDGTWERGVPGSWLAALIADWRAFDPRRLQARLDELTHLRVEVGGIAVHLVHAPGTGPAPLPLLLTHGWPSSFLEYLDLLPLLTDPASHGAPAADSFTVVAPSLPGFGFSGAPPTGGLTHEEVAELWYQVMTGALGYRRFVAHGSDLGAGVTARSRGSTTADGEPAFGRDLLLSTLTLYRVTRTAASSLLPYWAHRHAPSAALPADDPAPVPTAIDIFGGEMVPFPKPPRELAERYFTIAAWDEHDRGGHFPAAAEPRLLAERLRETLRPFGQPAGDTAESYQPPGPSQ